MIRRIQTIERRVVPGPLFSATWCVEEREVFDDPRAGRRNATPWMKVATYPTEAEARDDRKAHVAHYRDGRCYLMDALPVTHRPLGGLRLPHQRREGEEACMHCGAPLPWAEADCDRKAQLRIDPSLHWDHPVAALRIAVASDPATPPGVLCRMLVDADKRVRDAATVAQGRTGAKRYVVEEKPQGYVEGGGGAYTLIGSRATKRAAIALALRHKAASPTLRPRWVVDTKTRYIIWSDA